MLSQIKTSVSSMLQVCCVGRRTCMCLGKFLSVLTWMIQVLAKTFHFTVECLAPKCTIPVCSMTMHDNPTLIGHLFICGRTYILWVQGSFKMQYKSTREFEMRFSPIWDTIFGAQHSYRNGPALKCHGHCMLIVDSKWNRRGHYTSNPGSCQGPTNSMSWWDTFLKYQIMDIDASIILLPLGPAWENNFIPSHS